MSTRQTGIRVFVILVVAAQTIALGQETEVRVARGEVIAETAAGSVKVGAGRKAVLKGNEEPAVRPAEPLVDDAIELYQWVLDEKGFGEIDIDFASIQVVRVENEEFFTGAFLTEMPNMKSEASSTMRVGLTTILDNVKFYDLAGNLLAFDLDKVSERKGYYYVHFREVVKAGENFKMIGVAAYPASHHELWKEQGLWNLKLGNCTPRCLNYYRVILPESAIFVESSRPVTTIDSADGRVAVTMRNYTGEEADGMWQISFLWPEKDGTSLADLPGRFRGLEKVDEEFSEKNVPEPSRETKGEESALESLPWDDAGPEALEVYRQFVDKDVEYIGPWFKLGIKLAGGCYWDEAFDCFKRCEKLHSHPDSELYMSSLVWQGHIFDIRQEREHALSKYREALQVLEQYGDNSAGIDIEKIRLVRHDQWGIVIDLAWIKERLESPFSEEMMDK